MMMGSMVDSMRACVLDSMHASTACVVRVCRSVRRKSGEGVTPPPFSGCVGSPEGTAWPKGRTAGSTEAAGVAFDPGFPMPEWVEESGLHAYRATSWVSGREITSGWS